MEPLRVAVVGCGTMGSSHARAYAQLDGFALAGLVDRRVEKAESLAEELGGVPLFSSLEEAMRVGRLNAASICTHPDSHHALTVKALRAGLHVFVEKPLATSVEEAEEIAELAAQMQKKVVVGYILRHHPAWQRFVEEARTLGKPLVMRMNLNQQSSGAEWSVHKKLMDSLSPIVDCGVHYVDIMCQMTGSRPLRVQAIGARLTAEIRESMYNYGQLQVVFEDGSVGWYEAGWGPMMSETAYFVKDVIGPMGCISIAEPRPETGKGSSDIDSHTKTSLLIKHDAGTMQDVRIDTSDEPGHQALCDREQEYFLRAILDDVDLREHLRDAVNSLRIVLAADHSVRTGTIVHLP